MKVVCFDFDDVIVDGNFMYKIGEHFGNRLEEIKLIVEFLKDNNDPKKFYDTIKKIVRLAKGVDISDLRNVLLEFKLMPGTRKTLETLKRRFKIVIVSANDENLIKDFLKKYKLGKYVDHVYASKLGVEDGKLTGQISGSVIKTEKTGIIRKIEKLYRARKKNIIYIGDGLTDLPIIKKVGKGILFCPNAITQIEVFRDKTLSKKERKGELFLVEKNDLKEVLQFIS